MTIKSINPADRTTTKVIYKLVVEDPTMKSGVQYYICNKSGLRESTDRVEIFGNTITSAQANKLTVEQAEKMLEKAPENIIFPWSRVVSINNLTHKKAQQQGD